jgi:dihydroflavonol-4-reductase
MILITGATGHIGNVLVRQLLNVGEEVRALIFPGEAIHSLVDLNIEMVEGDILAPESLKPAFRGVRDVFHLAGLISILPGGNELMHRVNVEGTQNVIHAAIGANVRRLVYASSIHAISRVPHGIRIDEQLPFDPDNPFGAYDRSKAKASLLVQEAARSGLDAVIVCPTGVIGPYDYRRSEMGQLILDCMTRKLQLFVDGAYDFVDVRDVAEGLRFAREKGRIGENYILSGERIMLKKLMEIVHEFAGKHSLLMKIPMGLARFFALSTPIYYNLTKTKPRLTAYSLEVVVSNSNFSCEKAHDELGYKPRSLRETVADTVQWFKENNPIWQYDQIWRETQRWEGTEISSPTEQSFAKGSTK